ncbi:MAG: hypothetical protein R3B13_18100 [Polyangiaceae bacterium]
MVTGTDALTRLRQLRWFRARGVTWVEHVRALREIEQGLRSPAVARNPPPAFTVVVPVYSRPWNAALSVALGLATPGVARVVVCLNDPGFRTADLMLPDDPRLVVLRTPTRRGPVERYRAVAEFDGDYFFSPDDDVFLPPLRVAELMCALAREPASPHGFYGQHYSAAERRFSQGVVRRSGQVHVLNRAYAFTRKHLDRYLALLQQLEVDRDGIALDDDIVLSFCGDALPQVHDLGPYVDCPSEASRPLARWARSDADSVRGRLIERLSHDVGMPPSAKPLAPQPSFAWHPRGALAAALFHATPAGWLLRAGQRALGRR